MNVVKRNRLLPLAALLSGAAGVALWAQTGGYVSPEERLPLPPPEQPIPYSHKKHVGELNLECAACHQTDKDGFLMQFPTAETCMACHAAIKTDSPHIQKLAGYAQSGEPIPWVQIYRVPDFVWFAHASHDEKAGVSCADCHGPVAEREQMFKEKSTNMISCMACHTTHNAPNDCDLCHDPG
jgi:hypothetical protein